jgi:hypothetical protein
MNLFKVISSGTDTRRSLRVLALVGMILMLGAAAQAQSSGRWAGRIQLNSPAVSQPTQSSASKDSNRSDSEPSPDSDVSPSGKKRTLVGSWLLTVTVPDNPPPFDSFSGLWALTGDGILIASAQGDITPTPFPSSTSQYGAWASLGGRQFGATFASILYDVQTGDNMGMFKLSQSITLNDAGDEWSGPFKLSVYDPDGNVVAVVNGTAKAKRIVVEPLQ